MQPYADNTREGETSDPLLIARMAVQADIDERVVALVMKRSGLDLAATRRALAEAKRKIEAASLVGVAGFWT